MRKIGPYTTFAAMTLGATALGVGSAQAGKVHWKQDSAAPSCYALAFDDTDEWFATPQGIAFKKGVCLGQAVNYKVVLSPDQQSFTVSGAKFCRYQVGEEHRINVSCER